MLIKTKEKKENIKKKINYIQRKENVKIIYTRKI